MFRVLLAVYLAGFAGFSCFADTPVRVASYNIKQLSGNDTRCFANVSGQGDRLQKLQSVIASLDADVIGMQEISDRDALEAIFGTEDWTLVFDDEGSSCTGLAAAVRKPLEVTGAVNNALNAGPQHFLFETASDEAFPEQRDVLDVEVVLPDDGGTFRVLVHHGLSRSSGRADSAPRRILASQAMLTLFQGGFADGRFILVGDFNDTPDDACSNILETGNPNAETAIENNLDAFMVNVMEPVFAGDNVTFGRDANNLSGSVVNTVNSGIRQSNFNSRNSNTNTGDNMLDNILVPRALHDAAYVPSSANILRVSATVQGTSETRASDHLPIYADFVFGAGEGEPEGATEGTPEGIEEGGGEGEGEGQFSGESTLIISEYVEGSSNSKALEVFNPTGNAVNLSGWTLAVYSNGNTEPSNTLDLSTLGSSLAAGDTIVVANSQADAAVLAVADTTSTVTFFNGNDTVVLADGGTPVDVVGVVGEDPGTNWTDGGLATNEQTLRRKSSICSGNATGFNPVSRLSAEWDTFAQNTFGGLGSHTVDCDAPTEGETEGSEEGSEEGEGEGAPEGETSLCDTPGALYCEDFEDNADDTTDNANDDLQDLVAVSVSSTGNNADWHIFAAIGNKFARINGFGADEQSDDWLITAPFNLNEKTGEVISFDTAYNFDGPALEFLYSMNYNGQPDPSDADWTPIAYTLPSAGNFAFASSGLLDVSGISGTAVYFAWRYTSSGTGPGQSRVWEVDNILLTADLPVGEGEGAADGEGSLDGEGATEGEGEAVCGPEDFGTPHTADYRVDFILELSELLRLVQLYNLGELSCDIPGTGTDDGYRSGPGDRTCPNHNSDYGETQDWTIELSELLRAVQFYNAGGFYECDEDTEDGYCPLTCPAL